jgi:hypothetical protein
MAPFNGVPTRAEQVALALAPKLAASLSVAGSSYILYDCLVAIRRKRSGVTTYHRLMTGLCCCDVLMSVGLFTSTWPMPRDTPNVWGAAGTVRSCEAVGFLEQAGVSAVMYNASLSIYYLLRIRCGWDWSKIRKAEIVLHLVPIVFGIATMLASLFLDLFNSGIFDCWIAPFPQGCDESWQNGGATNCVRGDNASLYQWLFDLIPKWTSILLVTVNMWFTHRGVLMRERASLRYSASGRTVVARRLARQSYCYVGALYLTYVPVIVTRATELATGYVYYGMLLTISVTIPLQGFWNGTMCGPAFFALIEDVRSPQPAVFFPVLVYLRPRFLQARERQRSIRRREQQLASTQQESSLRSMSSVSKVNVFVRAVSEAVREGCLSDEEGDDREIATETTTKDDGKEIDTESTDGN